MFTYITSVYVRIENKEYKLFVTANTPIQDSLNAQYDTYFRYSGVPPIVWAPPDEVAPHPVVKR
jgi:hypothetical protein